MSDEKDFSHKFGEKPGPEKTGADDSGGSGISGLFGGGAKAIDFAKKLLTVGVGTAFLTEEALRTLVTEFKLPKELIGGILESSKSIRKEFIQNFASEMMSKVSDKVDPKIMMTEMMNEFFRRNEVSFEIKLKVKEKKEE